MAQTQGADEELAALVSISEQQLDLSYALNGLKNKDVLWLRCYLSKSQPNRIIVCFTHLHFALRKI